MLPNFGQPQPACEVIKILVEHGCPDVTPSLDLEKCKPSFSVYGGFGDIYEGWFTNGAKVAIKCPRMNFDSTKESYGTIKVKSGLRLTFRFVTS